MAVLPLDDVVKIIVNLSPKAALRSGFNMAMIMGTSDVISVADRIKIYSSVDAMVDDGFTTESEEYKLAAIYFQQTSKPGRIAVGRWDEDDENFIDALRACRSKNRDWYVFINTASEQADILATCSYIESCTPASLHAYTTDDVAVLQEVKALNYRRTIGQYSEPYPTTAVTGIIGWAMGANTGLNNSAYTLNSKELVGLKVDDLDETTVDTIIKANGNYYVNRGAQYDLFESGIMAGDVWFDEMINLDMLVNDMQLSVVELLRSWKKVPQTEGGVNAIKAVMKEALKKSVNTGFVAGGIWKGPTILDLQYGDAIEEGYLIQSEAVDEQAQADRENRIAPAIYVALKLAGAIHHVIIQVDVNR